MTPAADSDFLQAMAASSRQRDAVARAQLSDAQQITCLARVGETVPLRPNDAEFNVIAEIKKQSPAEGKLDADFASLEEQAKAYVHGGAVVLSVLTEPDRFAGSLEDLQTVTAALPATPVMRKDFLVSRYQVREARLAGASGVLLIAAMLDAGQLEAMLEAALELDMFALVEAFDVADLEACLPILECMGPALDGDRCRYLLGINCRDLRTLQVDFDHFGRMAARLPANVPCVAESGLTDPDQAAVLASQGYTMALVGTTLMRSSDPAATVAAIRAQGGAACS